MNNPENSNVATGDLPSCHTVPYRPSDCSLANASGCVGRFRIERFHAAGGLGEVYVARDTELHRRVALKRIRFQEANHAASLRRFMVEAEVTAYLEHPGVVPVHGLVQDEAGEPAYAMRFIKGDTLKEAIREFHGRRARVQHSSTSPVECNTSDDDLTEPAMAVSVQRSAAVLSLLQRFVAVCNTIAYAHRKGVIHRDIKPSNIMFGEFGETWVVDWGLAKVLRTPNDSDDGYQDGSISLQTTEDVENPQVTESDSTALGKPMGTIQFMSPEQATGQWDIVNESSDIYSLGATLYVILTGKLPFIGGSLSEIKKKIRKGDFAHPRNVNNTISPALDAICRKAMSRDQDQRYPSALALANDIQQWLADEPVSCYCDSITTRSTRWARRNRTLATSLVASGIITLIAVSISTAMLASANARLQNQSEQTNMAFGKAKEAIDQYLLNVGNSNELKQLELVDLRRELLGSAIPFYGWLAENSPQHASFELERAKALLGLAELHEWLNEIAASEEYAKKSLVLIETSKRSQPDDFSIQRLEAKAFTLLLLARRSEMDFDGVDKYLDQAHTTFKKLVNSGNPQDQIDFLDFRIKHAEYLEVANRHPECIELVETAVGSTRPGGLTDPQDKQWDGMLARLYYFLGEEYRQFNRLDQAQLACKRAIDLSRALASEQASYGVAQHQLANCFYLLGQIQFVKGQTQEALKSYEECERIQILLANNRPSIPAYRLQLAWALQKQASVLSDTNRLGESNAILVRALEVAERLCAESPENTEHKRLRLMLLEDSAENARKGKNDKRAEQLFQESLQGYQLILAEKPDAWESRLDQGWVLLKLGDTYKDSGDFARAAEYYQQVIASTDMFCEQLRDQASASELNFCAGYALFHVMTELNKFDDARLLAENQSSKYTENQGFFSVLACQCLIRAGKLEEAIQKLKDIETASSMCPTMLFEIGRAHNLIATQTTDSQQKKIHISSTLDWMKKAFEAGFDQTWIFDSDDYFPLLVAESMFEGLKDRFGKPPRSVP